MRNPGGLGQETEIVAATAAVPASPLGSRTGARALEPRWDIVIVGGGPAGSSAAIQLARRGLAARTLLLDAARFPREKLCGGGVVRQADRLLGALGVHVDVPSVRIDTIRFEYAGGASVRRAPDLFRVVRREEFDTALLREAERAGVTVVEGAAVTTLERVADGILVHAGGRVHCGRVVIGADGARSRVRRDLVGQGRRRRFVALEVLTGMPATDAPAATTAVFDFRPARRGLRGYVWDFPSVRAGEPLMNRGIGGDAWRGGGSLEDLFAEQLRGRGVPLERPALRGATAPLYDPSAPQSAPHVLLAGDAVGIDPWFGEGISVALGTGMLAANAAAAGLGSGDLGFADYGRRLRDSAVGWTLRRNRATARTFYRRAPERLGLVPWLGLSEVAS